MLNPFINFDTFYSGDEYNKVYLSKEIGTSDCTVYVPFFALNCHTLLDINDNIVIEYPKVIPYGGRSTRNYSDLLVSLKSNSLPFLHYFSYQHVEYTMGGSRNVLFDSDSGELLLCLSIKSEVLLQHSYSKIVERADPEDYILLVNNKLQRDPIYKNVIKRLVKEYISLFEVDGIDVVYTNSIEKWTFKNNYRQPNFKTVPEMVKHLNEEVPRILIESS